MHATSPAYRLWDVRDLSEIVLAVTLADFVENDDRLFGALMVLLDTAVDVWGRTTRPLPEIVVDEPSRIQRPCREYDASRWVQLRRMTGTKFSYVAHLLPTLASERRNDRMTNTVRCVAITLLVETRTLSGQSQKNFCLTVELDTVIASGRLLKLRLRIRDSKKSESRQLLFFRALDWLTYPLRACQRWFAHR